MALIFFAAGFAKLDRSRMDWVTSENLEILLIQYNYHLANGYPLTSWGLNIAQFPWLSQGFAAATLFFEAGYPLALFSRRLRWVFVPGGFFLLVGIRVLMGPVFEPMLLVTIFWIPWDRLSHPLALRLRSDHKYALLFNGGCGLCQRLFPGFEISIF